jgi:hypothetical protein
MAPPTPKFNGIQPLVYRIQTFVQEMDNYFVIQNVEVERWAEILDASILPPAKARYDAARGVAGGYVHPPLPPVIGGAVPAVGAIEAVYQARYDNRVAWLTAQYHGQREQQALRRVLARMRQDEEESPLAFHARVIQAAVDAGVAAAVLDITVEDAWTRGLRLDISQHLEQLGHHNMNDMLDIAEGYWNSETGPLTQDVTRFNPIQRYQEPRIQRQEWAPPQILHRTAPVVQELPQHRAAPRTVAPPQDSMMEDLAERFARLEAHVIDQKIARTNRDRVYRYDQPSRGHQDYNRQQYHRERTPERNPRRQISQQEAYEQSLGNQGTERFLKCFKCGEPGHYARDCQSEKVQPARTQRRDDRNDRNPRTERRNEIYTLEWEALRHSRNRSYEELNCYPEATLYPADRPGRERKTSPYERRSARNRTRTPEPEPSEPSRPSSPEMEMEEDHPDIISRKERKL